MYQDVSIRNKKILIFSGIAFVVIIIIAMIVHFILGWLSDLEYTVQIVDLGTCAVGMEYDTQKWVQKKSYDYVAAQLELAGVTNYASRYDATIRDGSCQLSEYTSADGSSHKVIFIIDIPALQYSFQVVTNYIATDDTAPRDTDTGSPLLYCVSSKESIYPDFNCANNPLIRAYSGDAVELNDIRNLVPYIDPDGHYYLQLVASSNSKSGYTIIITYTPGTRFYIYGDISEYRQTYRPIIEEYLTSHGHDPADYDFFEKWQ